MKTQHGAGLRRQHIDVVNLTTHIVAVGLTLAIAGPALADDARMAPATGTSLTYRLISMAKRGDTVVTTGQVYTYVIKSSDGAIAEGVIHPEALIYGCAAADARAECVKVRKMADAKQDGDLLTVPIPRDFADRLAPQNVFKSHYFMPEMRRIAQPAPSDDPNNPGFEAEPAFVVTNSVTCPAAELEKFVPLGSTKNAIFHCQLAVSLRPTTGPGTHPPAGDRTDPVTFYATYDSKSHLTVPAGAWDVENFSYKSTQTGGPDVQTDMAFSPKLGIAVKAHTRFSPPGGGTSVDATSELIAVSP